MNLSWCGSGFQAKVIERVQFSETNLNSVWMEVWLYWLIFPLLAVAFRCLCSCSLNFPHVLSCSRERFAYFKQTNWLFPQPTESVTPSALPRQGLSHFLSTFWIFCESFFFFSLSLSGNLLYKLTDIIHLAKIKAAVRPQWGQTRPVKKKKKVSSFLLLMVFHVSHRLLNWDE